MPNKEHHYVNYHLKESCEVIVTSEAGEKLGRKENILFTSGAYSGLTVQVYPDVVKQTVKGIGTSFTEASAYVLAHLEIDQRMEVMRNIFGEDGANFSLARMPIGSCDFCVEGKYSYAEKPNDYKLEYFSIESDMDGFNKKKYDGINDEKYDLLPMVKEALKIKKDQIDSDLRIIASAWTAPPWMKNIEDWYKDGTGGVLKKECESVYADYLLKYLQAYAEQGILIWGLTPVNEPLGNHGQWESMHFTPDTECEFISNHLGPRLKKLGWNDIKLLIFDQNRDELDNWANVIYSNPNCNKYVNGAAVHWYENTESVGEDMLDKVHSQYPQYLIMHTEGCIDNIGGSDIARASETDQYNQPIWFQNDDFWWNKNATDWAYGIVSKEINPDDHKIYTPVHRYAKNIIESQNHWVSGWIDWNIVLDSRGGPNHAKNYCGAPIMVDIRSNKIYYTPLYYILAQFSRTIRPGDKALYTEVKVDEKLTDEIHACASINDNGLVTVHILNPLRKTIDCALLVEGRQAQLSLDKNALITVRFKI